MDPASWFPRSTERLFGSRRFGSSEESAPSSVRVLLDGSRALPQRSGEPRGDERRRAPRVSCRLHGRVVRGRERLRVRIVDVSEGGLCLLSPVWLNPKQTVVLEIDVPGRATAKVQIEVWHIRREKSRTTTGKVWVAGAILRDADKAYGELLQAAGLAPRTTTRAHAANETDSGVAPRSSRGSIPATDAPRMPPARAAAAALASTPPSRTAPPPSKPPAEPTSRSASPPPPGPSSRAPAPPTAKQEDRSGTRTATGSDPLDCVEPRIFRLHCKARGSPRTRVLTLAADSAEQARKLAETDLGAAWDLLEVREV
ncbi:MAG: PilZ domain-containing protein [Myxococcota bacterium]